MRSLEQTELKEYLEFCKTSDREMPENFQPGEEKCAEIQQIVKRHMFTDMLENFAADDMAYGRKAALIALWVEAFQCGREFETRYQDKMILEVMVK